MPSTVQDWVSNIPLMQQAVLLSAIRNADGVAKNHPSKALIRWYRRCILISAFDGTALTDPTSPGGGSFTGPVDNITQAANDFVVARDEMTHHYFAHAMHAFQILGVHHPIPEIAEFWKELYLRMVNALHLNPETEEEFSLRLSDNETNWKAREDKSGGCST